MINLKHMIAPLVVSFTWISEEVIDFASLEEATTYLLDARNPPPCKILITCGPRRRFAAERWKAMLASFKRTRGIEVNVILHDEFPLSMQLHAADITVY